MSETFGIDSGFGWSTRPARVSRRSDAVVSRDPSLRGWDGSFSYLGVLPADEPVHESWLCKFVSERGEAPPPEAADAFDAFDMKVRPAVRGATTTFTRIWAERAQAAALARKYNESYVESLVALIFEHHRKAVTEIDSRILTAIKDRSDARRAPNGDEGEGAFRYSERAVAGKKGISQGEPERKGRAAVLGELAGSCVVGGFFGLSSFSIAGLVSLEALSSSPPEMLVLAVSLGVSVAGFVGLAVKAAFNRASAARYLAGSIERRAMLSWALFLSFVVLFGDALITGHALLKPGDLAERVLAVGGDHSAGGGSLAWMLYPCGLVFLIGYVGWKAVSGWRSDTAAAGNAVAYEMERSAESAVSSLERALDREVEQLREDRAALDDELAARLAALEKLRKPDDGKLTDEDRREMARAFTHALGSAQEYDRKAAALLKRLGGKGGDTSNGDLRSRMRRLMGWKAS